MTILELYKCLAAGQKVRIIKGATVMYFGGEEGIPEGVLYEEVACLTADGNTLYIYI